MGSVYTLIPRPIGVFAGLDMTSRYAFGLIYDRWQLSRKDRNRERFTDSYGIYCVYSRDAMAAEMGVSLPTLRRAIKSLREYGLIHTRMTVNGDAWRYYIPDSTIDEIESLAQDLLPDSVLNSFLGG